MAADRRLFGTSTPSYTPGTSGAHPRELFIRFTPGVALYLVSVRWYRVNSGQAAPGSVRLWDTTATTAPVWSTSTLPNWADTTAGWKEQPIAAGTQPALVAGRMYALSYSTVATGGTQASGYTPTPDADLTFNSQGAGTTQGVYYAGSSSFNFGLDGGFSAAAVTGQPAASGVIRLLNAAIVAWRNAGNTADLTLTANASDALTYNGLVVVTQAALDTLAARVTALEADMAGHTHQSGTVQNAGGTAVLVP